MIYYCCVLFWLKLKSNLDLDILVKMSITLFSFKQLN